MSFNMPYMRFNQSTIIYICINMIYIQCGQKCTKYRLIVWEWLSYSPLTLVEGKVCLDRSQRDSPGWTCVFGYPNQFWKRNPLDLGCNSSTWQDAPRKDKNRIMGWDMNCQHLTPHAQFIIFLFTQLLTSVNWISNWLISSSSRHRFNFPSSRCRRISVCGSKSRSLADEIIYS